MAESEMPPALPNEPMKEIDDARAGEIAARIASVQRRSLLALMVEVGKVIVQELFEGDLEQFRKRNVGDRSVDKVLEALRRIDPEWSMGGLLRAVGCYEQSLHFDFDRWPALYASHFYAVQPLPIEEQRALLDEAQLTVLSARDLEQRVREVRHRNVPIKDAVAELWRNAGRMLSSLDEYQKRAEAVVDSRVPPEVADLIHNALSRMRGEMESVRKQLESVRAADARPNRPRAGD